MPTNVEKEMRDIYSRFFRDAKSLAGEVPIIDDLGFRILCGPPIVGAPILISTNPGASEETIELDGHTFWEKEWPEEMAYAREIKASAFSRRLADLFSEANIDVRKMNATYTLMFRSKSVSEWDRGIGDRRGYANDLCSKSLREVIQLLKPRFIYAAGFGTFERLGCRDEEPDRGWGEARSGDERRITKYGSFDGIQVISTLHPSGSQYSTDNRTQMAADLRQFWDEHSRDLSNPAYSNEKLLRLSTGQDHMLDEVTEACIKTVLWVAKTKENTEGIEVSNYLDFFTEELRRRS
jgi:hypothetical protein